MRLKLWLGLFSKNKDLAAGTGKGQGSIETLAGVSIVLILLLLVIWQLAYRNQFNNAASDAYGDMATCNKIAGLISLISRYPGEGEVTTELDRDMAITSNTLLAGTSYCPFHGTADDANLVAGMVRIYDSNGVVHLENV